MDGIKDVIEKPMKLSDDELLKLNIENKIKEANDLKNKNCKDTKELHKRIDKKLEVLKRRRLDIKKKKLDDKERNTTNCIDGIKNVIEKPMKLSDDELLKLNIENKIKEANNLKNTN